MHKRLKEKTQEEREKNKIEIIKKMLNLNINNEMITKVTGADDEEIEKIKTSSKS